MPEITRDEIIGGRRVVASPAQPPHANKQTDLDFLLRAHVAPGYVAAADLITRHDEESDFASDACVYKVGLDPETGGRHLEEIAFEIVSTQSTRDVMEKAFRMHRRGVRRIFTIWVKGWRVCEWSAESQSWRLLTPESRIEDPCLVAPLAVAALLDAAIADNAVVHALAAKGNPAIAAIRTEGQAEGRKEGRAAAIAESVLRVLEARGVGVSTAQQQEILQCRDLDRLNRWLLRAALASSVEDIESGD